MQTYMELEARPPGCCLSVRAALCAIQVDHSLSEVIQRESYALLDNP